MSRTKAATVPSARVCLDCPRRIAHGKRCPPCSAAHREAERERIKLELRTPVKFVALRKYVEPRLPRETRYIMRRDFLLALADMQAELARQCSSMMMPRVATNDPLELPTLGRRKGSSGRQGYL